MGKSINISLGICVLLVLSVLWKPAYSENKCATGCKGSSGGPAYLTGHKYSYSVEGDVTVYLTGAENQETGVKLSAQVTVSALGNCAHVLRVQNLVITGPGGKKYDKPPGIEKPVRFTLENGALGAEICAESGDTRRSLNIKRAIISLLQNEHKQTSEVDVFGVCPTQSSSSQEGPARLVHRSRDLTRCAHREQGGNGLILSTVYNPNAEIKDSQVLQSTLYVESKVTNGVPDKVSATEEYLYRPFSVGQNGARAKVNTKLSLVGKTGGSDSGAFTELRTIIFENPHGVKSEKSNLHNALKAVRDTAKVLAEQVSYKSAGAFAQLVRILRVTNTADLLKVYNQVKENSLQRRVFLDGLVRTGTSASIEVSARLIQLSKLSAFEQNLLYLSLGNVKHITPEALSTAVTLLNEPNAPKELYLSLGAIAGAFCREQDCSVTPASGIIDLTRQMILRLICNATTKKEEDYTVTVLKGIRNMRYIPDPVAVKVKLCAKLNGVKPRVKVAALEAFQADPCLPQLKDTAIEIMENRNLDSEIRIKAYLTVIQCPCGKCANAISKLLDDEPSIQVGRFISTSLRHIKTSANPDMQLAKEHFSQIRIPTKYSVDDRKYSFYREFSYNMDSLGAGGILEQSVIYSQESFLPRSVNFNFTTELFGHNVNVLEIGGRQGNLDRVMEHFLGPKGYFNRKSPQEIFEDLQHRYDEVEKKIMGKLRGRRSLQQDINNFDKQIKDEAEPYNNELDLDMYVKLFGTDAVFLSLGDGKGFNFNSVMDSILKYVEDGCNSLKHFQEEIRAHILFLDAELAYPTSLGLPLKLNLIGSATGRLEASTKIDVKQILRDPTNAKIDITLNPSTDIEISGQLVVDADQVTTGLKVSANLHSATGGHLILQILENGQGFDLQYVLPSKKLEIVTASNDLVYVTAEKGQEETSVALKVDNDRKEYSECFDQLSDLVGLTLCGEISVPFSVSGPEAQVSIQKYLARYPLTGSSMIKMYLEQNDLRGYRAKGLIRRDSRGNEHDTRQSFELLFETMGSRIRKTSLTGELVNSKEEKTIKLALESPIKELYGQVSFYNKQSEVAALVLAKVDSDKYYGRVGVNIQGNERRSVYQPFIEYEVPGGEGTKSMKVDGHIVRQHTGPTTIYTLEGIKINIDRSASIDVKGHTTFSPQGFEGDLEASQGNQNMAVKLAAKDHNVNVRFTNTLNPNVNFDLKVYSENRDKYYQNDVDFCYGDNLEARRQTVIMKQLLKYQETDSGKYNVHTRNEFSINHIPLSAKVYAEIDSKKVDVELEGRFGANKAEFDLEARTHIKAAGDYSVKIDAEVDDKGVQLIAKRDIISADKSNFENVFVVKNVVKYELSGVVTHKNKADDLNFGVVGHLKVSGGSKTEDVKFDVGLQNNPTSYASHAEIAKGTVKYVVYSLKVFRGANPNGQLRLELKNTVSCNGNYKVTDADGSGTGTVIVDFVKLGRKFKGDVRFKVKAPIYSADGDLYLNYEKNNNDKIHFTTFTRRSGATVDSKNKLDYDGKSTEFNVFVDGTTNLDNGKFKGQVQVVLPNERTLELGLTREISTQNDVMNGNAELVLSDAPKRGATPSKFVYKGKIINTSYKTDNFNYEGQILISLKDGKNLQNSFYVKNIPLGNNKFKFDFKSEVNGNLIPKPASLTASNEYYYSGKMLVNDYNKYRVKGNYGSDTSFDLDFKDEKQFDVGDKKYIFLFYLTMNLPFEKAHYIKIVSDEIYLYPENGEIFEYNLKESLQLNGDEFRIDTSGKIGKSEGSSKFKYVGPHAEPFLLETTYRANLKGEEKSGAVAIKSNYGRGKSATVNIEATKASTQEYTLHINAHAPHAEKLKKLDINFNTKRPNAETYNSNVILDADGKVYKIDYLIVYSKANPVLDIKVNCPEFQKTCRIYMKGSNLSSNQGKLEVKLENIKDLNLDMTTEGIIQKDHIALKVYGNSEKLGLRNYYTEVVSKDIGSGKRLEISAKNNNANLLSGSTSFISKQEGSKMIIEGSGTVRLKEEQKSATFKYIRDVLTEGHEQGIETFMNVAIGERSYVAESRVTNLEYKYSYVYCEEKKQCAHAELNSKISTPSTGVLQHNVNVVLDLRKLGFAPEFGLQMLNEVSERRLPQYTLDVYLNKENKKYHLRVYSTPDRNQLPAGITITLPHREMALESVVNYRSDRTLPFPIKGEISLYMDKNKPHQKTAVRGSLDVTESANEKTATAEFGFSHPTLGREALVKFGGFVKQSSASVYKIECFSSFSHPHFGNERSSKILVEITPRTFKLGVNTPLVKIIEVDAEGNVNDNLQEGKLKFSFLQGKPVQVYAVARGYTYYELTTSYSDDTQRKLSIVGRIEPEKRIDVTADIILPGEKKNIAHGALYVQGKLVKSDYGGAKQNFDYFVTALQKDLDNLRGRISQLGSKANEEYAKTVEKAGQIAKRMQENYRVELEQIKRELADDKTFQEVDKALKSVVQYVGTILIEIYEAVDKIMSQIIATTQDNAKKISEMYEKQLAPQINQLYENVSAIVKEYMDGVLDLVAHFAALVSNFFDKHKAELQELTNTFTEIFKDLTAMLVKHLKEFNKMVFETFENVVQQIKEMPIIDSIKKKFQELGVVEQVLTTLHMLHEKLEPILPNQETKDLANAVYEYTRKKLSQERFDENAELRQIYQKIAAAVTSLLQQVRQQLGEMGTPSFYGLAMPQLSGAFFGNVGSLPSFEGSSSFSVINQALNGELPSALDLIKAYRPSHINPLHELPAKLRTVVVNGQHIFTFDGRHLTFPGTCRYVLAHDYVDRNFTLLIQLQNGLPKALVLEDKSGNVVELKENGQVAMNGVNHGFPVMEKDIFAFRETNGRVGLGTTYGLIARCTSKLTVCYVEVSGYYFNKLRGLLGDGNNEPYTDFKLPSGRVTTSEAEFGNSYRLAASCPQVRTPDHSHHHGPMPAACEQVFGGQSPLRPLSLLLDVAPFKQACIHACEANPGKALQEACYLARAYAALAVTSLLPAVVPQVCVQCNDADKPRKLGEDYTLELPGKQADIIVAVETTMDNERVFKNIAVPVVSQVIDSLRSKRVTDIKVHLVGITSKIPYPIVYDTDQKLKTAKVKFEDPSRYSYPGYLRGHSRPHAPENSGPPKPSFDVIEFLSHLGIDNVMAGYMSLLEVPLRAGAVKTTISVVGEKCHKRFFLTEILLDAATIPMFKADGHTQNIIAPASDLKFDGREATVIAYDSHSVLVYGDKSRGKDTQESRRKLFNPPDSCTDYIELNDGLVISATNFERNAAQQKEFIQTAGLAIVDRMLSERRTQRCACAYADPFTARSVCVPTSVKHVAPKGKQRRRK